MTHPGADATSPWKMPRAAWWQVLKRVWSELGTDNAGLMAAGVAFYAFLSLVPAIAALLLSYGLFASPQDLSETMMEISTSLPANAAEVLNGQIAAMAAAPETSKGIGLVIAIALAVYGATKGVDAILTAVNTAYDEEETRGFIRRTLTVFIMTAALVALTLVSLSVVSAMHLPPALAPVAPGQPRWLFAACTYATLLLVGLLTAALIYRFAPARKPARAAWLTPGAIVTALAWALITSGFGAYSAAVGDYGAAYGSLAGVVALLTWLYFSAYALILGAELNAELELQTRRDSTTGRERPMGERGAEVADHLAANSA